MTKEKRNSDWDRVNVAIDSQKAKEIASLKKEAKRKRKAEEKLQRQAEWEAKPILRRFGNQKKVRQVEARRLEKERKELKRMKRAEHRAKQPKKRQEKRCNRVHVCRIAA